MRSTMTTIARIPAFRYFRRSQACEDPRNRCLHRPQEVTIQIPHRRRSAGQCRWLVTKLVTARPLPRADQGTGRPAGAGTWSIAPARRRSRACGRGPDSRLLSATTELPTVIATVPKRPSAASARATQSQDASGALSAHSAPAEYGFLSRWWLFGRRAARIACYASVLSGCWPSGFPSALSVSG